mgnify:CR=1 FL=1
MPDCSLPRTERLRSLGAVRRMFESGESGFIFPFRYVWFAEADEIPSVEVLFSVPLFSILNSFNSESNRATPLFLLTYNTNGLLNRMEKTQP